MKRDASGRALCAAGQNPKLTARSPQPLEVVVGIIRHRGKILIARRRPGDSFAGKWEFPGGKREDGESLDACLRREIQEELDLQVGVGTLRMIISHPTPHRTVRLHCFDCRIQAGRPLPRAQVALHWVLPSALSRYPFPPASLPLVEFLSGA